MYNEFYILTNTNILNTIKKYLEDYFNFLNKTQGGDTVNNTNYLYYSNKFILEHENYYKTNKTYFDTIFNYDDFIIGQNENEYYGLLTLHQYLQLLSKMLILHDDSFNIDYTLNCPPNKNISKIRNIYDSQFILSDNIYCKYIIKDNEVYPLFIGSFTIDKNNFFCYIYNICSNANKINKNLNTNFETKNLLNKMLNIFYKVTNSDTFALFIDLNNPSFSKAFSLYFNNGFLPLVDIFDTYDQSILEKMLGCDSTFPNYIDCQKITKTKMLMMKTTNDRYLNILYYKDSLTSKDVLIKRGSVIFYDTLLAFSYRCSCIFDEYYEKNKYICKDSIKLLNKYFTKNNGENQSIVHISTDGTNIKYFDEINSYINDANNIFSPIPDYYKQIVLNNQELYRFLSLVKIINVNDIFNKNIRYINPKISIGVTEYNIDNIGFSIQTFPYIDTIIPKQNYFNSKLYTYRELESKFYNEFSNFDFQTNINDSDQFIFIPCNYAFFSNINNKQNFIHSISMIYNRKDKELYYFDSQTISDRRTKQDNYVFKLLLKLIVKILRKNNCEVNNEIDLTKYIDINTKKSLYTKIQSNFADDEFGSLCVILSHIPYIAVNLIDINKNIEKQMKFYVWFLFFSAIILKQKQKLVSPILNLQSNIMITFPYLYTNIYEIIKSFNNNKQKLNQKDIDILNTLDFYNKQFIQTIQDLNNRLIQVINDKDEIPYKYSNFYF